MEDKNSVAPADGEKKGKWHWKYLAPEYQHRRKQLEKVLDELEASGDDFIALEDDDLTGEEVEGIGDLGNESDNPDGGNESEARKNREVQNLVDAFVGVTRWDWMAHRIRDSLREIYEMRSAPARPWPKQRVPEELWRRLGDHALGFDRFGEKFPELDELVAHDDEEERLIEQCPSEDREGLRQWFDSFRLLGVFHDEFKRQRELWEADYWARGLDESFGKRQWTGPSGNERSNR